LRLLRRGVGNARVGGTDFQQTSFFDECELLESTYECVHSRAGGATIFRDDLLRHAAPSSTSTRRGARQGRFRREHLRSSVRKVPVLWELSRPRTAAELKPGGHSVSAASTLLALRVPEALVSVPARVSALPGWGSTASNRTIRTLILSRPPTSFANATSFNTMALRDHYSELNRTRTTRANANDSHESRAE